MRLKKLTPDQFDTALEVRGMYEARSSDLGAMEYGDTGRAAHDHEAFVQSRGLRALKLQRLATIERSVALQCRDEPACLQMLRGVIGNGVNLSAFGAGRAFARHLDALTRALDVAMPICGKG
jgi:hypothetical protein